MTQNLIHTYILNFKFYLKYSRADKENLVFRPLSPLSAGIRKNGICSLLVSSVTNNKMFASPNFRHFKTLFLEWWNSTPSFVLEAKWHFENNLFILVWIESPTIVSSKLAALRCLACLYLITQLYLISNFYVFHSLYLGNETKTSSHALNSVK